MAEKGKVRKGFFFYLAMFLIMIFAFFMVCVCIMLFNPGKSVFGFQYYSLKSTTVVTKTTDESASELKLDEDSYSQIEINSNGAGVEISNNTDYEGKNGIVIVANATGFIKTPNYKDFTYSVVKDGDKIKVDLDYTEGFLKTSSNFKVVVHLGSIENFENFKNTKFVINSSNGNVNIGGKTSSGYTRDIPVGSLDVDAGKGSISFSEHADNTFKDVLLKTEGGTVDTLSLDEFKTVNPVDITAGNGKIKIKKIKENLNVNLNGGIVEIEELAKNFDLVGSSNIISIKKVSGDLNLGVESGGMKGCRISVDEVAGSVNLPNGEDSSITIKKVGGEGFINTSSGNVSVGTNESLVAGGIQITTVSGDIEAYFDGTNKAVLIGTEKGNVNVHFPNAISGTCDITAEEGNVTVELLTSSKAKISFNKPNGTHFDLENVKMDILNGQVLQDNPYYFNCTDETKQADIQITTNRIVTLNLA